MILRNSRNIGKRLAMSKLSNSFNISFIVTYISAVTFHHFLYSQNRETTTDHYNNKRQCPIEQMAFWADHGRLSFSIEQLASRGEYDTFPVWD